MAWARHERLVAAALMGALLFAQVLIWFPFLPNQTGRMSVDFSFYLPNLLAGDFWFIHNGPWVLPWFSPAECAGSPFYADPQGLYLSPLQALALVMPPIEAVRMNFLLFSACGFWGMRHLTRHVFLLSAPAALLAAGLFMMNGFFAARMVVGHLSFAPFMLLPAFAACVIVGSAQARTVLRACLGGIVLALCIQGGMVHLLGPFYLAVLALAALHGLRFGGARPLLLPLCAATLVGLLLCAGKLTASLALMSHFPRNDYRLPGIPGLFATLYVAARSVFTPVSDALGSWVVNSTVLQEQHELEYGVSIVPLPLLAALLVHGAQHRMRPRRWWPVAALGVLLLVPVALNAYAPGWNVVLKALPVIGSSSNLLRWFAAYIPVAILAGAMALDTLCAAWGIRARGLAAAGIAIMVLTIGLSDHQKYGPRGLGFYDAADLQAAWHEVRRTGQVPAITRVVDYRPGGQPSMQPERQNALAFGASMLPCYQPLFGYGLEKLPFGNMRLDDALASRDGVFNFKDPACYVFPGANRCAPGDQFTQADVAGLKAFLDYRPFPFARPLHARLAGAISLACLAVVLAMLSRSAAIGLTSGPSVRIALIFRSRSRAHVKER